MRMLTFARRCAKEVLRDPLTCGFGLLFPLALLLMMTAIQANIPVPLFELERLTPGITVFGLSFLTLFSATLIAKDRESAFLQRLYTTPLTASDFIIGYLLPFLPVALVQTIVCYAAAVAMGLALSLNILYAVVGIVPMALFHIALGLLCGSVMGVKQVGGLCGALLTNLSAYLSGAWIDMALMGGVMGRIAKALPFYHAVEMERALLSGQFAQAAPHLLIVIVFCVSSAAIAVLLFLRQMTAR